MRIAIFAYQVNLQMKTKNIAILSIILLATLFVLIYILVLNNRSKSELTQFDGEQAYEDVAYQISLGPRIPASQAHSQVGQWIEGELSKNGWEPELQRITSMGHSLTNIIGRRVAQNQPDAPWIILGAHYDSRLLADRDLNAGLRSDPVPGANDGASGVAVLLELARSIPRDLPLNLWLVFFDGEDNGNIPDWDWILGSRGFVENLDGKPDKVIIVDMVGDRDLNIYFEKNSNPDLSREIWDLADRLGYSSQFIPIVRHSILDDHIPFLEAGITAVDIIDFDYPAWHTTADTIDQISPESLKAVGETLLQWLIEETKSESEPPT